MYTPAASLYQGISSQFPNPAENMYLQGNTSVDQLIAKQQQLQLNVNQPQHPQQQQVQPQPQQQQQVQPQPQQLQPQPQQLQLQLQQGTSIGGGAIPVVGPFSYYGQQQQLPLFPIQNALAVPIQQQIIHQQGGWLKGGQIDFVPRVNVSIQGTSQITLQAAIPGCERQNCEVECIGNCISISGYIPPTNTVSGNTVCIANECNTGRFYRVIQLPCHRIDNNKVSARLEQGVLRVDVGVNDQLMGMQSVSVL